MFNDAEFLPVRVSSRLTTRLIMDLLLLTNGSKYQYVLISDEHSSEHDEELWARWTALSTMKSFQIINDQLATISFSVTKILWDKLW